MNEPLQNQKTAIGAGIAALIPPLVAAGLLPEDWAPFVQSVAGAIVAVGLAFKAWRAVKGA